MMRKTLILTCAFMLAIAGVVAAQTADKTEPAPAPATTALATSTSEVSVSGEVVSSTATELVIKTDAGEPMTFALDPETSPKANFSAGERVTVQYHSLSGGTVFQAVTVDVEPAAQAEAVARDEPAGGEDMTSTSPRLPQTASVLPLIGLLGLLSFGGAIGVRVAVARS
jgi:hypothetical protein